MLTIDLNLEGKFRIDPESRKDWESCREVLETFLREKTDLDLNLRMKPVKQTQWRTNPKIPLKATRFDATRHYIVFTVRPAKRSVGGVWEFTASTAPDVNTEQVYDEITNAIERMKNGEDVFTANGGLVPNALDELLSRGAPSSSKLIERSNGNGHHNGDRQPGEKIVMMPTPTLETTAMPTPPRAKCPPEFLPAAVPAAVPVALPVEGDIPSAAPIYQHIRHMEAAVARETERRKRIGSLNAEREVVRAEMADLTKRLEALDEQEMGVLTESDQDVEAKEAIGALKAFESMFKFTKQEPVKQSA
jgi:hypothetical protein